MLFVSFALLLFPNPVTSQPAILEKQIGNPEHLDYARSVLEESVFSITGSLVGAPRWLRPFVPADDDITLAQRRLSPISAVVPYRVFPLHSRSKNLTSFNCLIESSGTTLSDSVLLLYADSFDAHRPLENLVAYNDDVTFPTSLHAAFTHREGVVLEPDRDYYLVVTTFDDVSVGGGSFTLTTSSSYADFSRFESVPTLGEWGLIFLVAGLLIAAMVMNRRQKKGGQMASSMI